METASKYTLKSMVLRGAAQHDNPQSFLQLGACATAQMRSNEQVCPVSVLPPPSVFPLAVGFYCSDPLFSRAHFSHPLFDFSRMLYPRVLVVSVAPHHGVSMPEPRSPREKCLICLHGSVIDCSSVDTEGYLTVQWLVKSALCYVLSPSHLRIDHETKCFLTLK